MWKFLAIFFISLLLCNIPAEARAERKTRRPDEVIALVHKAIAFLHQHGRERTLAEINNPKGVLVDGELYLFAFNLNGDGITRANTTFPALVGKNLLDMRDPDGIYIIKRFLDVANSKSGKGWVDYKWPSATSGKFVELKTSYIERAEDLFFGCGIPKEWAR
ncbi:cache domain-containing protein [Undibacterium sp. Di27W]|uniref:cache domain-containing protein n=1 Tax=Undibacterium sp. Di27W TaxID=3413036 RepID=UPI003BF10E7C